MRSRDTGIALMELMIVVILISVVATAYWNLSAVSHVPTSNELSDYSADSTIQTALDEIGYHLYCARKTDRIISAIEIDSGDVADRLGIWHQGSYYSYFLDDDRNLIRQNGKSIEALASGVSTLRVTRIGQKTLVVTIVRKVESRTGEGDSVSNSFSTVVLAGGF